MTCDDLLLYLSAYIDQDLDEELTLAAHQHLASCPNCRVVLNTTQQTILLAHTHGQRTIPAARRQALFTRLQNAFRQRPETRTDDHPPR